MNSTRFRSPKKTAENGLSEKKFMRRALTLAKKGLGYVSPNPVVGAVIVKDGQIIGEGYHRRFGGDHAEVVAIQQARADLKGTTMYVTLEPCCFFGKTPPCVNRIIETGIGKVVIGTVDPDPRVNQKGIRLLRENAIEVEVGLLEDECKALLRAYCYHRLHGRPFTTIKIAQTLDGQIATQKGHSQWISSATSRTFAHQLRREHDAIMIGTGTALNDNPMLNIRHVKGVNPRRLILDASGRLPLDYKIFQAPDLFKTTIITTTKASPKKLEQLHQIGVEVLLTELNGQGLIDLPQLWQQLAQVGVTSLLVEGGSQLITSILQHKLANRFVTAIAPLILGQGTPAVRDLGHVTINEAIRLVNIQRKICAEDIILMGDLDYK